MPEKAESNADNSKKSQLIFLVLAVALAIFIARDPQRFWHIFMVILGFSAVIFVHELGHFTAAKAVGIMVEAFAIGFGPVVIGIKRVGHGFRIRVLPELIHGKNTQNGQEDKGPLGFIIPYAQAQAGETEYQIRLIPLGGFVKMLGQEDVGADKPSDDPRAYGNKAVWKRMIVIAAGVIMNLICGAIVFMIVFSKGIELPPAIVGDVVDGSPAAQAGLRGGDEIIAIDGKENVDFFELMVAGVFTDDGEKVALKVRNTDGSEEIVSMEPKMNPSLGIKGFGIGRPSTLTIADLSEKNTLEELRKIGFEPGDQIVAVNGLEISRYDQLAEKMFPPVGVSNPGAITLTVNRTDQLGNTTPYNIDIGIFLAAVGGKERNSQVLGMIPRLKVSTVTEDSPARQADIKDGDIILRFGSLSNPTLEEFKEYCKSHEDQSVDILVLRGENDRRVEKLLQVTPKKPKLNWWQTIFGEKPPPVIGFMAGCDTDTPIVADCKEFDKDIPLMPIPRGVTVTAIADQPVQNWQDMIALLGQKKGLQVEITYRSGEDQSLQTLSTTVPDNEDWIGFAYVPDLGDLLDLPLTPMKKTFKGENWFESLGMGLDRTYVFAAQTYLMLRGMVKGTVSPKSASGPVGILKMSYTIVEQKSYIFYFYFMAMINICIAVFNFLPLPILDGGHFVLLIVEKIKGSPVSIKVQEIISYAGLVLILGFVLFITYHDIVKLATGQL